jgi:hypothetical protein
VKKKAKNIHFCNQKLICDEFEKLKVDIEFDYLELELLIFHQDDGLHQ